MLGALAPDRRIIDVHHGKGKRDSAEDAQPSAPMIALPRLSSEQQKEEAGPLFTSKVPVTLAPATRDPASWTTYTDKPSRARSRRSLSCPGEGRPSCRRQRSWLPRPTTRS